MTTRTLNHVEWRRFHDPHTSPKRPDVAEVHCADEAVDFIGICHARPATGVKLKPAGSHWSLSESTVSDGSALETNWPDSDAVPRNTGLAVDLLDLISDPLFDSMANNPPTAPDAARDDPCLRDSSRNCFFVHLKSGTRVYAAYSLLDGMAAAPTRLAQTLNAKLVGSPRVGPRALRPGFILSMPRFEMC